MNEKTIQIIPAPSNLMYAYDGGTAQPVACLALVELADGDRIRCLDSDTLFCGDDGFMLPEYTGDGVHPYGKFAYLFSQWLCEQITQGK